MDKKEIVVVIGAGRTGSSMLTNILFNLGMSGSNNTIKGNYQNEEGFFEDEETVSVSSENTQEHTEPEEAIKETYIKVEIDSVDKLVGSLKFATIKLDEAMGRVNDNHDLKAVLSVLENINKKDFDFLKDVNVDIKSKIDSQINNIDFKRISKEIDSKINSNIDLLDKSSQKLKTYTETFNDVEILDSLDKVERVEKFLSDFKFRSVVFSCIFGFISSLIIGFYVVDYFQDQKEPITVLSRFFKGINYKTVQDKDVIQLLIPKDDELIYIPDANLWAFEKKINR